MNPQLDPSLPFSSDTTCQAGNGSQSQIPAACLSGQMGSLPVPGPASLYGLGSASISPSCPSLSPCALPH